MCAGTKYCDWKSYVVLSLSYGNIFVQSILHYAFSRLQRVKACSHLRRTATESIVFCELLSRMVPFIR